MTKGEDIAVHLGRDVRHLEPVALAESDESLAARAATDPAAMTELYRRYVARVDRYCRRRLRDPHLAEDVTSQIFLKALEGLRRGRIEHVSSWIFTIAHNEVVSHYRRERHDVGIDEVAEVASHGRAVEDAAIAQSDARDMRSLLPLLTADQQRVIELRLAGLTSLEIRQVLGRSRSWVGTTEHRAVNRLRDLMITRHTGKGR
jgi:RNA polymerase sigma-70 factor (ECF subfamily)